MIYSMCNLHDVSWGTKGSTTTGDLGGAKLTQGKDGKDVMEVAVPTNKDDLSELWLQARGEIRNRPEVSRVWTSEGCGWGTGADRPSSAYHRVEQEKPEKRSASVKQSDGDKNFRTNLYVPNSVPPSPARASPSPPLPSPPSLTPQTTSLYHSVLLFLGLNMSIILIFTVRALLDLWIEPKGLR